MLFRAPERQPRENWTWILRRQAILFSAEVWGSELTARPRSAALVPASPTVGGSTFTAIGAWNQPSSGAARTGYGTLRVKHRPHRLGYILMERARGIGVGWPGLVEWIIINGIAQASTCTNDVGTATCTMSGLARGLTGWGYV
jgi:hypothetical protein